jgi:transcriptional regulator with XRE-family HTH domain
MTQQLLAERAGVSIRTVQKLEAGADPRMGTVAKLARALNVSIGELFGETAA